MKFTPVSAEELEKTFEGRRGRVSYPIIKGFMESGLYAAKVDFEDPTRKVDTMYMLLKSYISNHEVPIKVLKRKGRIILVRIDITEDGQQIPDWKKLLSPIADEEDDELDAAPIVSDVESL